MRDSNSFLMWYFSIIERSNVPIQIAIGIDVVKIVWSLEQH